MSQEERNPLNLVLKDFKLHLVSSTEFGREKERIKSERNELRFARDDEEIEILEELENEQLPPLPPRNRAQLQVQSPNRVRFYWSLKSDPFSTLQKIFGSEAFNYSLVAKLINQTEGTEQIFPIEMAGSNWFEVEADSTYRVDIGLFAPDKPFIRLLFSNTIQTPRSFPSPFFDWSPEFAISKKEFVQILNATGFEQDAVELALANDDLHSSVDEATRKIFLDIFDKQDFSLKPSEMRYILLALASRANLESLREEVSPTLFAFLQRLVSETTELSLAERLHRLILENFDVDGIMLGEELSRKTFAASLVEFRRRKPSQKLPKLSPISSLR